ncbi:hypothetical protein BCR33DRAFT_442753 [Rhizoclosmatium globosum]|uniref:Uncharacterized protein n=1 Tax=Rhizoclosmatium globosum TaxID=329046 RepID=A0A1Y2BTN7_9FUNG|nr:hypothetical protein BCR33DRAFT_442753 [Rhizoclosmatium globosum]|eukprot:ORY37997.1 hypothetical protein BCR33DRAFT_442753 [Rhizoclosmatium globosum]
MASSSSTGPQQQMLSTLNNETNAKAKEAKEGKSIGLQPVKISQSLPQTTWDQYQYALFAHPAASLTQSSDDDDDLEKMVDWVVGSDSPTLSSEEDDFGAVGTKNRLSTSSFSSANFLFQSTSNSYKQTFHPPPSSSAQKQPPNSISKFDADDLTFDMNDLDLDPTTPLSSSFKQSFPPLQSQSRSSLLQQSSLFGSSSSNHQQQPTTTFAKKISAPSSSSEQTPTSTFKSIRIVSSNTTTTQIPDLNLPPSSSLPPPSHLTSQTFQRYGTSPSTSTSYFGTSPTHHRQQPQPQHQWESPSTQQQHPHPHHTNQEHPPS